MGSETSVTEESVQPPGRVLLLPSTRADALAMGKLFDTHGIRFSAFADMVQLCRSEAEQAGLLIVSEEAIVPQSAELLRFVADPPVWSDLPVLVLSRAGRESFALASVIEHLGNVSVVERPVRTSTLLSLVRSALRARKRQYQVRDYLLQQEQAQETIRATAAAERAARGEAERAGRTKDEFLATLSHELRTPLHAVLGWTQVLRKSKTLSDDVLKGLDVIERNARSQSQIIDDLLDMSSILSGKVRLDVQRLDLATVINTTIDTVRPSAEAKGIRLNIVLDPMAGPVRGDPSRLQQILWNLLTNAVKFTPKNGRIDITLARVNSHLEIEINDSGEGISADFLPHVFDRFRQADASSTRRHGGLGLGLSIVKQLIELHGGSISVKSAGKGSGATFRMMLPVMATTDLPEQLQVPRAHPARSAGGLTADRSIATDLERVKVLIVDDEPDARALIERLLHDCNAHVTTAGSAPEAIEALLREKPDILISDIGMPEEDGYGLIRRVRMLSDGLSSIPAIALTAYARVEDRVKAIQAGFQLHLSKPVEPVELVAMVESLSRRAAPKS